MAPPPATKKALVVFFSLSGQTKRIVQSITAGFESGGVEVHVECLHPAHTIHFPLRSFAKTISMMMATFFRRRVPIKRPSNEMEKECDLVVLAGPTWSYNPSGPILSFLDLYGSRILRGKMVLPVISCRGYWRTHWFFLKGRINACGGIPLDPWVFTHTVPEPWRTIGVFLYIWGKNPHSYPFLRKHYGKYGHSYEQIRDAGKQAKALAERLLS